MRYWITALMLVSSAATQAADVEVYLHGQVLPGVHTSVRYAQPSVYEIHQPRVIVVEAPVYQQQDWGYYCRYYDACHHSVRFVTVIERPEHRHWRAARHRDYEYHDHHGKKEKRHHRHHHD